MSDVALMLIEILHGWMGPFSPILATALSVSDNVRVTMMSEAEVRGQTFYGKGGYVMDISCSLFV